MRENNSLAEGSETVVYQSSLRRSTATLTLVGDLLRGPLRKIGSRRRKLPPGKIAMIVLAVLRHDQRLAALAGTSRETCSKVLRDFADQQPIRLARGRITVLAPERPADHAG